MTEQIKVSLCIPTNGIVKWVRPVLDSIYASRCRESEYEVIVTDNGNDPEFQSMMEQYAARYQNLIYKKTDAVQFLNQIEAFKLARGNMIKFINHRYALKEGALQYLIDFSEKYTDKCPGIYFLNQAEKRKETQAVYENFDAYVGALSYWSSWSAGTTIWKKDLEELDFTQTFNKMFPHTDVIFSARKKGMYIIDNTALLTDLEPNASQKGKYDLFDTFAVEYVKIIERLYKDGDITLETFEKVKKENLDLVMSFYVSFVMIKRPCSYDLSNFSDSIVVYYKKSAAFWSAVRYIVKECFKAAGRILHIIK